MRLSNMMNLRRIASSPSRLLLLLIFVIIAIFFNSFSDEKVIVGKVVKVIDGDTIEILDKNNKNYRVRFFGMDAPESKQAYGKKSREFLASMIASKTVTAIQKDKDKYSRIVAIIKLDDEDINKKMVVNGYAWAYTYYSDIYAMDMRLAREQKLGLWADKNPIEPYEWRKMNR